MEIKSWQIASMGFLLQIIFIVVYLGILNAPLSIFPNILFLAIIGLLYIEKTKKIGAILSVILGLYMLYINSQEILNYYSPAVYNPYQAILNNILDKEEIKLLLISAKVSFVSGIMFFGAGIYYFWRKV